MQFTRKSKKDKQNATGSFGGLRSSSFIPILFQIYYAIGWQYDVLPGDKFKYNDMNLGNITMKVLSAIKSLLDTYFQSKRMTWTDVQIDHFDKSLKEMFAHVTLVWYLSIAYRSPIGSL